MRLRAVAAVLLLMTLGPAFAHAAPPAHTAALTSPRRLATVTLTGSPFPDADVLAAANLQIGAQVTEEDFRRATEALGQSGAFVDVRYKYDYTPDAVNLQIEVQPAEKYTDVEFDNFVWMDETELRAQLRKRVPLFSGKVPVEGEMLDQLALAIDWVLNERGVPGHAEYERTARLGDTSGAMGPVRFSVRQVNIRIAKLSFPGASPEMEPLLRKASEAWAKESYSKSLTVDLQMFTLPRAYARRGFLNAKFKEAEVKALTGCDATAAAGSQPACEPGSWTVEVALPVVEGRRYQLGKVTWQGNKTIPETRLAEFLTQRPDKNLDEPQLHDEIDKAQASYGRVGHPRAALTVVRTLDESLGVANYVISVDEGPLYRMGALTVEGLDHKEMARVEELWPLREGDVFSTLAIQKLPSPTQIGLGTNYEWKVTSQMGFDDALHTVDVTLHFEPQAKQK